VIAARCRRCAAALEGPAGPLGWQERDDEQPAAGPFSGRRCPVCGWNNLDEIEHFYQTDLAALADRLPTAAPDLSDTEDRDEIEARVRVARSAACSALRDLVLADHDRSLLCLVAMLSSVRGTRSTDEAHRVLGAQQIYACLLSEGPIDLRLPEEPPADDFTEAVFALVNTIRRLSDVLREISSSMTAAASLRSGVVRLAPSAGLMWTAEANLSRPSEANARYQEPLVRATDDVEHQVYGAAATELLVRLAESPPTAAGITVVDLASSDPATQLLRRHTVLTAERWRSRLVPSFFSADPRLGHRTAQGMLVQAAEADWLAYTPVLDGRQAGRPVGVTSTGLVRRAAMQSVAAMSGRLHLASNAATGLGADEPATVRTQARAVHGLFERAAADELTEAGVPTSASLERLAGRPLPCGEIDLVGGCVGAHGPVVVIGECKNVDFTFFKDLGPDQMRDTIRRASAQARRKATWAASNWRAIVGMVRLPETEPTILAIVVTRTISAPPEDRVPVFGIAELTGVARAVRDRPARAWRDDLRAGVVTAGR
jgi:hypothetical protein